MGGGGDGARGAPFCVLMSLKRRMRAAHGRVARTKLTRILRMPIVVNTSQDICGVPGQNAPKTMNSGEYVRK